MNNTQTILAGSLFFQMMICAVFIAFILSSLNDNLQNIQFEMVINLFSLLLELLLNYFSCAYAHSVTSHAMEVAETTYMSGWYRLPVAQQKIVQFMIFRAQEPFYLKGYQIFTCSMETFAAVIGC